MRTYRELLAIPEVRRMVPVLFLARLAAPMLGLSLLLAVVERAGWSERARSPACCCWSTCPACAGANRPAPPGTGTTWDR